MGRFDVFCDSKILGFGASSSRKFSLLDRATTVNRNIGYPRFRTHGSVSVRLFQISVRFRFAFFLTINVVKTDILTGESYKI